MEENHLKPPAICRLCGKSEPQMLPAALVRPILVEEIKKQYPDWMPEGYICHSDLNRFRSEYIQGLLESEKGELIISTS